MILWRSQLILNNMKDSLKIVEPSPKYVRWFFFWSGLIATIAYRIVIVLNLYSTYWVKVSWYIGTIGFILYFGHRYDVAKKRANLVKDYNLMSALDNCNIEPDQKQALHYLVKTSLTSKSRYNSAMIFILSVLALLVGIYLDLFSL